jgi:hypothetical protein
MVPPLFVSIRSFYCLFEYREKVQWYDAIEGSCSSGDRDNKFRRTFDRELTKKKKASSLSSIFFLLLFFSLQWLIIYSSVYVEYNYVLRCIGALSYIYMRVWANCYFFLLGFFFIFNKTCCICFVLRSNPFLVMRALAFKLPDDEMWE